MDRSQEIQDNINEWADGHRRWLKEAINPCGHHEMYTGRNGCVSCRAESKYLSLEDALEEAFPFEPAPEFRVKALPQTALYGPGREEFPKPLLRHFEESPDMYREWILIDGQLVKYIPGIHSWDKRHVRKTARECTPGTVVWLTTGNVHGLGWKRVVVKEWRGHGDGYASLYSTEGYACGRFRATDLLEVQP